MIRITTAENLATCIFDIDLTPTPSSQHEEKTGNDVEDKDHFCEDLMDGVDPKTASISQFSSLPVFTVLIHHCSFAAL